MRPLRNWQIRCLADIDTTISEGDKDFLVAVPPSSGKTILGLTLARRGIDAGRLDFIVVLVPSIAIQNGWIAAAPELGLTLTNSLDQLDGDGVVLTYQSLNGAGGPIIAALCAAKRVMAIADEIHHGGEGKAWGDAIQTQTELAAFRLGLTGTPFRSDNARIPILRYGADGSIPHFEYTVKEALDDAVIAQTFFRWMNGSAVIGQRTLSFDESAGNSSAHNSRLLDAVTKPGSNFARELLAAAHGELMTARATDPTAAGLVIAKGVKEARAIRNYLTRTLKTDAALIVNDEPDAQGILAAFKTNDMPWLVAVAMVTEGVDIERLKVLAYLSTNRTELSFIQATGRVTRLLEGRLDQRVMVHLPKLAQFEDYANRLAEARRHEIGAAAEGPAAPAFRVCAECGETSPLGAKTCTHCDHRFPTRMADRHGQMVMSTDGCLDGATLGGRHYSEADFDAVIDLWCRSDAAITLLRRNGRMFWGGNYLMALSIAAEREKIPFEAKLAAAIVARGPNPITVPDEARYAATPQGWRP